MEFPKSGRGNSITITTNSRESIGTDLAAMAIAHSASGSVLFSNSPLYIPFVMNETMVATQMFAVNGTSVSGQQDFGIFYCGSTSGGLVPITSVGSTTQSGTSSVQTYNIPDVTLEAGFVYYMGYVSTSGSATYSGWNVSVSTNVQSCGVRYTPSFLPPPFGDYTEITALRNISHTFIPLIGVTGRSVV